jgi:hypothetical protein
MTVPRPTFRLVLRPEPDIADPDRALRALLNAALRSYGLRAVEVVEVRPDVEGGS